MNKTTEARSSVETALKMAIKALLTGHHHADLCNEAINACKEALASHSEALESQEPDRTGMVYYKNNACKAKDANSPDCICWTPNQEQICPECGGNGVGGEHEEDCSKLSQEQEPVAYMLIDDGVCQQIEYDPDPKAYEYWVKDGYTPLYTHPAQPLSEWISVKEKLPNNIDRVLCYVEEITDLGKSHFIWNCSYNPAHGFNGQGKNGIVTHWMLLPNPPQIARAIEQAHGIGK